MSKASTNQGVAIPNAEQAPLTFVEKLSLIQATLKAPKGQYNSFGKYHYRKCEDILEAVKPMLLEHKLCLVITDEIVVVGDRFYVKATAALTADNLMDTTSIDQVSVVGFAREEADKKGMDAAQLTGATSSYARKYALNGLFCIDDSQDADSTNDHGKGTPTPTKNVVAEVTIGKTTNFTAEVAPERSQLPKPTPPSSSGSFKEEREIVTGVVNVGDIFEKSKTYISNAKDKAAALAMVVNKHGSILSPEQIASLQVIGIPQLGEPVVVPKATK